MVVKFQDLWAVQGLSIQGSESWLIIESHLQRMVQNKCKRPPGENKQLSFTDWLLLNVLLKL